MEMDKRYTYKPEYDPYENLKTRNGFPADVLISTLQKSIRRADEHTAIRAGYELYVTSIDMENYLWKRLSIISVEDIGFGDPTAPILIQSLKELRKEFPYTLSGSRALFIFQAIRYMCKCKKERSSDIIKTIVIEEYKRGKFVEIPTEYDIYDWHTKKGRAEGKTYLDFLEYYTKVEPHMDIYDNEVIEELKEYTRENIALKQE